MTFSLANNDITVHLFDAQDQECFPIYVYTNAVPRVGDHIHYWVDYSFEHGPTRPFEEMEPEKIDGIVEKVEIEYRRMRWGQQSDYTSVSVWLKDYKVTLPTRFVEDTK